MVIFHKPRRKIWSIIEMTIQKFMGGHLGWGQQFFETALWVILCFKVSKRVTKTIWNIEKSNLCHWKSARIYIVKQMNIWIKALLPRAKIIWKRLDEVQMYVSFETTALFTSPNKRVEKRGNFKTNILFNSIESFLYCPGSRRSKF